MQYVSTRGAAPAVGFADVLLTGLAPDGGLYVPDAWPRLDQPGEGATYAEVATDVMDVSRETKETHQLYGLDSPDQAVADYGLYLLVARRMIERGVRFVQVWDYGWDMHSEIFRALRKKTAARDLPTFGLRPARADPTVVVAMGVSPW